MNQSLRCMFKVWELPTHVCIQSRFPISYADLYSGNAGCCKSIVYLTFLVCRYSLWSWGWWRCWVRCQWPGEWWHWGCCCQGDTGSEGTVNYLRCSHHQSIHITSGSVEHCGASLSKQRRAASLTGYHVHVSLQLAGIKCSLPADLYWLPGLSCIGLTQIGDALKRCYAW